MRFQRVRRKTRNSDCKGTVHHPAHPEDGGQGDALLFGGGLDSVSVERDDNRIYFYTEVTDESIRDLVRNLNALRVELLMERVGLGLSEPRPIHLHICSGGGDLFAGLAAVDAIRACNLEVPVHTHIEGEAASAATIMSISGAHRTIGANSYMLIHQLAGVRGGKYEEMKDAQINDDMLMSRLEALYVERSTMSPEETKSLIRRELLLSAETALEKGLVDEIR